MTTVPMQRAALEKLCKWRSWFAAWQTGTRDASDPECRAIKHHREATILLRAEVNALTGLLIAKGVITGEEFDEALYREARALDHAYEESYPGVRSTPSGISYKFPEALQTMTKLGFPP